MSQIESTGARTAGSSGRSHAPRLTRLNELTFWIMLAVLVLAPIPFGSARPVFWGLAAIFVGLWTAAYMAAILATGQVLRIGLNKFGAQALLASLFCLWLIVQMLPVGMSAIQLGDGLSLPIPTISLAPGATLLMLIRQLTYGLFFFLVLQISANENRRQRLFDLLLGMIVAYGVYGLVALHSGDTILGLNKWAYSGYATGTFVNRNSFATFLAMGAVIAAARFGKVLSDGASTCPDDGKPHHLSSNLPLYGLAFVWLVMVVLQTGSRMGFFVTAMGAALALALTLRRNASASIVALVPPVLLILALTMLLYGGTLFERLGQLDATSDARWDLYRQTWQLIMQRPLTGFGGGAFELAFPLVHQAPVNSDLIWSKAHSSYLALWAELGLVFGSLPLIAIALIGLRLAVAVIRKRGHLESQAIALGVLAVGGVHSLVDFSLEIPANTFVFLALLAAGAASTVNLKASR
ncbi:O-antigen ligase family protein [Devosia ginsengisoli]|uniref:O-antigen ligase family protein n=1 Tax=Devosia ginsengisoli TaxID=400770 RepID=A0A5B8LR51_9HYPH|nr:O-antigen ligase family protein [Devosia ginsengisoli]QDZ10707.1 O-antigen ligase family protein [Devosia ginsengisoli]